MDSNSREKGHDVEPLRIRKFEVGDLVFAKLKGYPPWPSKINQIESLISGGKEKIRYNVYFYGTHQSSILRSTSLYHYDTYAKSIVEKWGRKPKFHEALKELEREMMDKITYLNQLRMTSPDPTWCHGFNTACESLASDIVGAQLKVKSKSHCKPKKSAPVVEELVLEDKDECVDEARKLGYEVMYIERIPFPDTPESLVILSLKFNKDWVKEESQKINTCFINQTAWTVCREEERMKNCYVKLEPLPPQYAHLDPKRRRSVTLNGDITEEDFIKLEDRPLQSRSLRPIANAPSSSSQSLSSVKGKPITPSFKEQRIPVDQSNRETTKDYSDSDSEEAVETCPVCRLCFFSLADLKDHEKSVHGKLSTAESLFDQLITGDRAEKRQPFSWKEGYPVDSVIGSRM